MDSFARSGHATEPAFRFVTCQRRVKKRKSVSGNRTDHRHLRPLSSASRKARCRPAKEGDDAGNGPFAKSLSQPHLPIHPFTHFFRHNLHNLALQLPHIAAACDRLAVTSLHRDPFDLLQLAAPTRANLASCLPHFPMWSTAKPASPMKTPWGRPGQLEAP